MGPLAQAIAPLRLIMARRLLWPAELLLLLLLRTGADRPADSPCITWVKGTCTGPIGNSNVSDFAWTAKVKTGWQWTGAGCPACPASDPSSFSCAYLLPCYADGPNENNFGHRDTVGDRMDFSTFGCNTHLPSGGSSISCNQWFAAKGPQWENFGWQVTQQGASPAQGSGQLITDPSGKYVLARASAAIPYPGCGPGITGWVNLSGGKLGCMEYDAATTPVS